MKDRCTILVLNDDAPFMRKIRDRAEGAGLPLRGVRTLMEAKENLMEGSVEVLAIKNPLEGQNILDRVCDLQRMSPATAVIVYSSEGSDEAAQKLIAEGVLEYLPYPTSVNGMVATVEQVLHTRRSAAVRGKEDEGRLQWSDTFIGESAALYDCLEMARRAAENEADVLITGETGSGKELLAGGIHARSSRKDRNFVVVDCAALPEHLVESTLFGHEKGAFTGAERARRGLIQEADGGTLFLDEIGELPPEIQKRFLRVLDTKTYRRVGGEWELKSSFLLIAATNRDLDSMVSEGLFREDLLYRISTVHIRVPPLRERPEDIELLSRHHLEQYCADLGLGPREFSPRYLSALREYSWPGNIRELFNTIERSVTAAGPERTLHRVHLPAAVRMELARNVALRTGSRGAWKLGERMWRDGTPFPSMAQVRRHAVAEAEADYLLHLISRSGGDVDAAIRLSGLSRSRLYALLKRHNLSMKR